MAKTDDVAAGLQSVEAYGGQLAAAFHNYSLTSDVIPRGFTVGINVLNATVTTLKQLLTLLRDDVDHKKNLFSQQGFEYVHLLALECGTTLAKIESIVEDACLGSKERKALKKQRRASPKVETSALDPTKLSLDEKKFLDTLEKGRWRRVYNDIEECMERLYDLQLHLLLVYQVVTVGALSTDMSYGKVDIQSIVAYHDRIKRTADRIGIKTPDRIKCGANLARPTGPSGRRRRPSGSRYDTLSSSSESDSDDSGTSFASSIPIASKTRMTYHCPPPPPPRPGWPTPHRGPPPPLRNRPPPPPANGPKVPTAPVVVEIAGSHMSPPSPAPVPRPFPIFAPSPTQQVNGNPPAYIEKHTSSSGSVPSAAPDSTLLGTVSPTSSLGASTFGKPAQATVLPSQKTTITENEKAEPGNGVKPGIHEARLFKNQSNGLAFKFKSIFRTKESLAEEMRRTLSSTESRLLAFIITMSHLREVPHSAFHSLEATHLKTILSQLHDNTWYKTFSTLNAGEQRSLRMVTHPVMGGRILDREIVVLKVLQDDKILQNGSAQNQPQPAETKYRRLLVIVREKLVNGEPLAREGSWLPPPPPPPVILRNHPPNHELDRILTTFAEYTVRARDPLLDPGSWSRALVTREYNDSDFVQERIDCFQDRGGSVIDVTLLMTEPQSQCVARLMEDIIRDERDFRFEWCWVELSLHTAQGEILDFRPKGTGNIAGAATIMHLIAKRTLKPNCNRIAVYNSLMNGPPPPPGPGPRPFNTVPHPPGPPGPYSSPIIIRGPGVPPPRGHPCPANPPGGRVIDVSRRRRPASGTDYSSDSDSSISGSDSAGWVKWQLRRSKRNQRARKNRRRWASNDSNSDSSGEEDEEEDVIEVKLQLKPGDDMVTRLVEMWTPAPSLDD